MRTRKLRGPLLAFFVALLAVHTLITLQGISEYFLLGHQGWNASLRSMIARNYVRYGAETGGRPIKNPERLDNLDKADVHWHHPPGINMLVGASFAVFGESEAAARLVPVLSSTLSFLLLFLIVRRRYGDLPAFFTVIAFMLFPMQIEYGKMVSYEATIVALVLLAIDLLERRRVQVEQREDGPDDPRRRAMLVVGVCAALCAAAFVDWPGFIFAAFLGVDALVRRPRQPLTFFAVALSTTLLLLFLFWWLGRDAGPGGLRELATWRTGQGNHPVSLASLAEVTAERLVDYFGWIAVLLSIAVVAGQVLWRRLDPVIFVLGFGNLLYIGLFRQAASVHNFFIYFLTPAIAVATGVGLAWPLRRVKLRDPRAILAALLLAAFVGSLTPLIPRTHARSYHVLPPDKPHPGFPFGGRLDRVLVAKTIHALTDPDDQVAFHASVVPSIQMRYYIARPIRQTRSLNPPSTAALFVASERRLSDKQQRLLGARHPVLRMMGYLIYDLRESGVGVRTLRFEADEPTWMHTLFESAFYPPHELVEDDVASRGYEKRLGLGGKAQR